MKTKMMRSHVRLMLLGWLLLGGAAGAQLGTVPEPQTLNVIYRFDAAKNALVPLERATFRVATKVRALGFGGLKATADIEGGKSAIRFAVGEPLEFVVQLPNGVDPAKFRLYRFDVKQNSRLLVLMKTSMLGGSSNPGIIQIDLSKHGQSSYKLTPTGSLAAGEYGFGAPGSNDGFCFGVD